MKEPGFFGDSLPEGVPAELTVSELEEMACRQQQQIESQRQLLAAKEQRLRFLKQHEAKHQLVATEQERLRRLRDKVETQEQKLRKLRALRGQVDQTKLNNVSLTSDLESIRALFNEKEKELSVAVAKVEELTRQLEELQRGRDVNSNQVAPSAAAIELEKLRAELLYRNKLNEQHSARLTHQRELLAQRQEEMAAIDRRIAELQERLHRKRLLNQQLAHHINKQQSHENNQKIQQMYPQSVNQSQSLQQQQLQQQQKQAQSLIQQKQHQQKLHQMLQLQKHHHQQQQQQQQQQLQQQTQGSQPMFNHINMSNKNVQLKNTASQGVSLSQKSTALGKTGPGTNIAAIEPYHHVPSAKSGPSQFASAQPDLKQMQRVGVGGNVVHRKSDQQQHMGSVYGDSSVNQQRSHYSYPAPSQKDPSKTPSTNDDHRVPMFGSPHTDDDRKAPLPPAAKTYGDGNTDSHKSDDRLPDFWPNKFDAKYQTLPSGTKYSHVSGGVVSGGANRYDYRKPAEGIESTLPNSHEPATNQKFGNANDKRLLEDGFNNNAKGTGSADMSDSGSTGGESSKNASSTAAGNQQSLMQQMNIVRSIPIPSNSNKGLATALPNSNYVARSTALSANNVGRPYEIPPYSNYNHSENHSSAPVITTTSTSVTFTSTYQKPVSSVSPIYQTSSTRIQPVQPQIIGSFSVGHQNHQNLDPRKNYQSNSDPSGNSHPTNSNSNSNNNINNNNNNNHISKPALPPKPAPPIKVTPPPPPRQSAFHTQFIAQSENKCSEPRTMYEYGRENTDANLNHEVESRLAGLDFKDKSDKKYYSRDSTDLASDLMDSNVNSVRGVVNMNTRNGIVSSKDISSKMTAESPPPLPSVEPPSDEEIEKSTMKLKTIYVQSNDNNNNKESKESNRVQHASMNDRLMSDLSQDSSSSDTSSAENNYFVGTNRRIELPPAYLFPESVTPPKDLIGSNSEKDVDIILNMKNAADQINVDTSSENEKTSPTSLSPDSEDNEKINTYNDETQDDIKKIKKGNLKNNNSANNKRRVSFDPLALLLDASLEGELELVIRTAGQVKNPSAANDEGITALHNAICAGHFEIVRFLVQFGCDVNAQDSDGWTPLHCAASCNNLPMVRFLVEHGACIFATTLSDQETAAEKCEEDEEGFDGCSEFLYSVQEKLGILNNGVVYAVFDYEAHNPDELSFKEGDRLTVLRKGDEWEREWWWSRVNDKEGYIPRNLLGLYPRIHPNSNRIQD